MTIHKVLERQLKKLYAKPKQVPEGLDSLLAVISDTYTHNDEDRALLERSLEISSRESSEANRQLKQESGILKVQASQSVQIKQLEKAKIAMTNLLDDLEEEKKKVESIVVLRTQELNSEKARLIASINSLSAGFILADVQGEVILRNKIASDLLQIPDAPTSLEKIAALLSMSDTLPKQWQECVQLRTSIITPEAVVGDKTLRLTSSPVIIISDHQEVIGIVFTLEDITEERQIAHVKEEFVSIASHQLRTPLTAIKGYTGMLLEQDAGPLNPQQQDFVSEIKVGNDRMIDLVTALLNVSRIDLGVFTIEPQTIDLREIATSLVKELSGEIDAKKLKLTQNFDEHLPKISADPKLVRLVLQNLLSNAVKYTDKTGKITCSILQEKDIIKIIVTDNGCGIPASAQNKIFTKLYRADNARQIDVNGNGLGMYITKEVVEQSGGKIYFVSKENKGTTFTVELPLAGVEKREGSKMLS